MAETRPAAEGPACGPGDLAAAELQRLTVVSRELFAAVEEARVLADGYALRLPSSTGVLLKLGEFLAYNRVCCGFLRHQLTVEPRGGASWLELTGPDGARESLAPELVGLLPRSVAAAAGIEATAEEIAQKKAEADRLLARANVAPELAAEVTKHIGPAK